MHPLNNEESMRDFKKEMDIMKNFNSIYLFATPVGSNTHTGKSKLWLLPYVYESSDSLSCPRRNTNTEFSGEGISHSFP